MRHEREEEHALTLWYEKPARRDYRGWEQQALPIGNGYMGAKIFGGIRREQIQFNEKTLWTGGPGTPGYTLGNTRDDNGQAMREIQSLLAAGDHDAAQKAMHRLQGTEAGFGAYQDFGTMYFDFPGLRGRSCKQYRRALDLRTAVSTVRFQRKGLRHTRTCFMSYPDRVFVAKFDAEGSEKISFRFHVESAQRAVCRLEGENTLVMTGSPCGCVGGKDSPDANDLRYAAVFLIVASGGTVRPCGRNALAVTDADSAVLYMCAMTDYALRFPTYRSGVDPLPQALQTVQAAAEKGYDALLKAHLADYQELFDRVALQICQKENAELPTDKLLKKYKQGKAGLLLEMLYFQYGRYLLIASSRAGSLPANLQGVWNAKNRPAWQSDYHLNVNLQMNYWPAHTTNLSETALPLLRYVQALRKPGRITAAKYAGIGERLPNGEPDPERPTGWMVHTQTSPMGMTGPGSDWRWGWAPANGAWMMQNAYECYTFSGDTTLLAKEIYPMMEECARLWAQLLLFDAASGRMVVSPGFSPEHGPVAVGNTYDQELVWQLYTDVLEAAQTLLDNGWEDLPDRSLLEAIRKQLPLLQPLQLGKWGQVKEWFEEDRWPDRGFRSKGVQKNHRHISHLLGLFPGSHITAQTPEYQYAARISLEDRGDGGTGWSKAMKICAWARLQDGNRSHRLLEELLRHSTLENLWDTHPPFQIDGNFGATAGIAEMLLQSHVGSIRLLPALPDAWADGSVKGLVARGNFVMDLVWRQKKLVEAALHARVGGPCRITYPGIHTVHITDASGSPVAFAVLDADTIVLDTKKGGSYHLKR